MTTYVVSGFHPAGYIQYGKRFLETFDEFWPKDVRLIVYGEEPVTMPRGSFCPLFMIDGVEGFIKRNQVIPEHCGRGAKGGDAGYNFRFDAVKFCRQGFIPHHAAQSMKGGDIFVWSDADVVTFAEIPQGFVERQIGDADLCHLGRINGVHSEIGFWAVRINDRSREFLRLFSEAYNQDAVFVLKEWHSAFVFDYMREHCAKHQGLKVRNMTPNGYGHVWWQSELCKYMDHLKGDARKRDGKSKQRQLYGIGQK